MKVRFEPQSASLRVFPLALAVPAACGGHGGIEDQIPTIDILQGGVR
jgi:hypothetical protein